MATAAFLDLLGEPDRELILRGSTRVAYPAGAAYRGEDGMPRLALIVERGLVRMFVESEDGRQASVAYLHAGDVYAVLDMLGPAGPQHLQALEDSSVVLLDAANLDRVATSNVAVAQAAIRILGGELTHLVRIISVRSLGSMTERLAFDLLERVSDEQLRGSDLVCAVTHEQLADSIGSTREVVTRIVGDLRRSGIIATSPRRIHVLDPSRLARIVRGVGGALPRAR